MRKKDGKERERRTGGRERKEMRGRKKGTEVGKTEKEKKENERKMLQEDKRKENLFNLCTLPLLQSAFLHIIPVRSPT